METPTTMRTCLLRPLIIAPLLVVTFSHVPSPLQGMAMEPEGLSRAGIPQPKGKFFYVAPAGNDAWSGQLAEPNPSKTDGPFATLVGARDAVRSLQRHEALHQPVTVYMRGGVYTLSAPLVFLPEDSGTVEYPITYAAYPGETVVLSGGRTIAGWKKAAQAGQGNPLWTVEVPGVKEGEWYFQQLFVDGERRQRARLPNKGFYHAEGQFLAGNPSRFKFHPGEIHAAWAEQGDVEVVGLEKWGEFRLLLGRRPSHQHRHPLFRAPDLR